MSDFGVPGVVISEVLPKKSMAVTFVIRKVNDRVRELCKNNKFHFISHHYITRDFLYHDGVHMTDPGAKILANNIVDYINNFTDNLDMKNKNYSKKTFSSVSEFIGLTKKQISE